MTEDDRSSTDLQKLRKLVQLDLNVASARWEVLTTPESGGLVPGPTDYYHLMAELTLAAPVPPHRRRDTAREAAREWIAPGAARDWLDPAFRMMLAPHQSRAVLPSRLGNCEALAGTYTRTRMRIDGFICRRGTKALVYLPLTEAFAS